MKCENCENRIWFGDYGLHYCDITKKVVNSDSECHIENKGERTDDYLFAKNFGKSKKD